MSGCQLTFLSQEIAYFYLCFWHVISQLGIVKFDEISKLEIAAVSALCWLSQFCTLKKKLGIGCMNIQKFVNTTDSFSYEKPSKYINLKTLQIFLQLCSRQSQMLRVELKNVISAMSYSLGRIATMTQNNPTRN